VRLSQGSLKLVKHYIKNVPNSYAAFWRQHILIMSTHFPAVMAGPGGLFQPLAAKCISMGNNNTRDINSDEPRLAKSPSITDNSSNVVKPGAHVLPTSTDETRRRATQCPVVRQG
jgi:hypothetical protein